MNVKYLTLDEVIRIHEMELARYGGMAGLRDQALLESALAQPMASFGGALLHEDLFAMAAAYLYHIVKNHPFLDGNKRTGLIVALTFLAINGVPISPASERFYETTIGAAEGRVTKDVLVEFFRETCNPSSP
jgi:death on curing protein